MNNKYVAINQFLSVQNCTSWFFEMRLLIFQVLLLDLSVFFYWVICSILMVQRVSASKKSYPLLKTLYYCLQTIRKMLHWHFPLVSKVTLLIFLKCTMIEVWDKCWNNDKMLTGNEASKKKTWNVCLTNTSLGNEWSDLLFTDNIRNQEHHCTD